MSSFYFNVALNLWKRQHLYLKSQIIEKCHITIVILPSPKLRPQVHQEHLLNDNKSKTAITDGTGEVKQEELLNSGTQHGYHNRWKYTIYLKTT